MTRCHRCSAASVFSIACFALLSTLTAAAAEGKAKPTPEKWRPKDGLYVRADTQFTGSCEDAASFLFELSKKRFVVDERWGCKITKIADTATGVVQLNMTCNESEIAGDDEGKDYKEVMTLRKISDTSFHMRLTNKGKIEGAPWRVNYCEKLSQESDRADAGQKEAALKAGWRPRDGVYASPGADFDDRCMKSGNTVVGLAKSSLSIGNTSCHVAHVSVEPPNSVTLDVNCGGQVVVNSNGSILGSSTESVMLSKTDDQSVLFRRSRNGRAAEPDQQLRYCPEAAQRDFTESKTK